MLTIDTDPGSDIGLILHVQEGNDTDIGDLNEWSWYRTRIAALKASAKTHLDPSPISVKMGKSSPSTLRLVFRSHTQKTTSVRRRFRWA